MSLLANYPFAQPTFTLGCRYGYSTACAGGLVLAAGRIGVEQRKGAQANRQVQLYSLGYALSCALEIGLDFQKFPYPQAVSLLSNGLFFGAAALRLREELRQKDTLLATVSHTTCFMEMANAVAYVTVGPNRLSTSLGLLAPVMGFGVSVWPYMFTGVALS